jgi:hypothetical protein
MKINCEEAAHICNKSQYKEAGLWEIIKLKLHHVYCKACLKHSQMNSKLTKLCNNSELQVLDESIKNDMKKELEKQL